MKINGTVPTWGAIASGLAALMLGSILTVVIPRFWSESGGNQVRFRSMADDIAELRHWGPEGGDRYTAEDARIDWRNHHREHQAQLSEINRKLNALLIREGLNPEDFDG